MRRARWPAPLSPAGLPGPLPGRGCCRWGAPLCLLLFSAGLRVFTRPRFRRRDEVFQNVTFLPASFPALWGSEDLQAGGGLTPRVWPITSLCFEWPIVWRDKATATLFNGYRAVLEKLTPGTCWDCPSAGSWCGVARGAVERGPESFRHVSFQCFFCSLIGAQINDLPSCFQIWEAVNYDENRVKCKDVRLLCCSDGNASVVRGIKESLSDTGPRPQAKMKWDPRALTAKWIINVP